MVSHRPFKARGVTLIELLFVVVVIGVLAGIAYPSYLSSIRKSRRADGVAAITAVQLAQEKLRANCPFYAQNLGGAANVCGADAATSSIPVGAVSSEGRYTLALGAASGTGYTVTATGVGDQANDSAGGTICTLVLTVNAANPNGLRAPAACWD